MNARLVAVLPPSRLYGVTHISTAQDPVGIKLPHPSGLVIHITSNKGVQQR